MPKKIPQIPENEDDLLFNENDMNIGPFVNLLTDFGFKKVLGQEMSKKHLMKFLNLLIFANTDEKIETIEFLQSEELGEYESERKVIFDLKCKTNKQEIIIVEMQKARQQFFTGRSTYYGSKAIVNQAIKGVWNFKLNKVYVVSILNFELAKSKQIITHTKQIDPKNPDISLGYNEYFYIELPKFTKKLKECENELEQWIYVMKNLGLLRDAPTDLRVKNDWKEFFELANIPNESSGEYKNYLKELQSAEEKKSVELAKIDDLTEELKKSEGKIKQAEQDMLEAEQERGKAEQEAKQFAEQLKQSDINGVKKLLKFNVSIENIIKEYPNFTESEILILQK